MGQEEVFKLLVRTGRFMSAKEISKLLGRSTRVVRKNLAMLSKGKDIIIRMESVRSGFRRTYKYGGKNNGQKNNNES